MMIISGDKFWDLGKNSRHNRIGASIKSNRVNHLLLPPFCYVLPTFHIKVFQIVLTTVALIYFQNFPLFSSLSSSHKVPHFSCTYPLHTLSPTFHILFSLSIFFLHPRSSLFLLLVFEFTKNVYNIAERIYNLFS